MRAEQAAVSSMVSIEMDELCDGCPLKDEFADGNVFANVNGRSLSGTGTEFYIGDESKLEGFVAHSIVRTPDIIKAFNGCEQPVNEGTIFPHNLVCGAVNMLQSRKGK